jgi:tRNA(Ile)-lysidine synthase
MLPLTPITDYRLLEPFAAGPLSAVPSIIRPLLEVPRAAILAYCAAQGLTPRFDYSNLDTTYFRNRLRHELLPLLEKYVPNVRRRLCHTAAVVAADYEVLTQLQRQSWNLIVRAEEEQTIVFDRAAWQALPVSMQRATLRHAACRLRPTLRDVDFVHVEQARQVGLRGTSGAQATLPAGLVLLVGYDTLTIGDRQALPVPSGEHMPLLWSDEPVPVQIPGATRLPRSQWMLEATILETWDVTGIASNTDPWTAYLDMAAIVGPLMLRPRRPGDRFRPQGMGGHSVKLSAFLINLKEPRSVRDRLPLLVDAEKIVWVCGRRIAEEVAVGPRTRNVLRLKFIPSQVN